MQVGYGGRSRLVGAGWIGSNMVGEGGGGEGGGGG